MQRKVLALVLCFAMAAGVIQALAEAPGHTLGGIMPSGTLTSGTLPYGANGSASYGRASAASGMNLTFGEFVGSNSFFNENQAAYEIFGNIREYHPWGFTEWTAGWYEDANGKYDNSMTGRNPRATFMNTWGVFDEYYRIMHEKGVDVTICLKGDASGAEKRPDHQDPDGRSAAVPASYLGHAQSMFQLAARYGSNRNVDPALVRVAAGTEKRIGLGYVRYYENFNEPNLHGFTGAQFAAMLSADYDGHMRTLGPDAGIKQADPNAKMVLGGLAGIMFNSTPHRNSDYEDQKFVDEMMAWFDANRTLEQWRAVNGGSAEGYQRYPFDVISCHSYNTNASASHGISPEEGHTYERVKAYVDYCNKNFPGKEVWLSEFGWDTAQGSPWSATVNNQINTGLTGPEVQGRWLVRQYLMLAAAGLDRARQYMIPDTGGDRNNPGWFATSGMVYGIQGSADFKPSWYYVGTMSNVLKDASLDDVQIIANGGWTASGGGINATETNGPWALRFNSTKSTDRIYALWLPTSQGDRGGANVQDYTVAVPDGYRHATLITLKDKVKWGERTDVSGNIRNGSITVSISEKPIFLVLSEGTSAQPQLPASITVRPTPSTVYVNGVATVFEAYIINGNNYFKLRDLAFAINGTEKQFDVFWEEQARLITLTGNAPYTVVGQEMIPGDGRAKRAVLNTSINTVKDGSPVKITAYLIAGNNFVRLCDVMQLLDVKVTYDPSTRDIGIDTSLPY